MTISEYQKLIDDMLQKYEKPYWEPLSQLARLSEEVGEVARVLNHMHGDKPKKKSEEKQDLADELADVIFVAVTLANTHGIDLEKPLIGMVDKLEVRDAGRFPKKK